MITLDWNAIEASACEVLDREGWKGLTDVCELLKQRVPHYQWVGIYWMNSEAQELYLGPDNYLACSMETKAELVVPIYRGDRLIGQIDIDSHYLNPFVPEDEALLRRLAAQIAALPEAGAIG
jgi:GAF domain-containing protein